MAVIPVTTGPTPYPTAAKEFTWTASTPAGDTVNISGDVILLIYNSSADTPYDYTINGEPDEMGRDVTITAELGFGEYAIFGPIPAPGWRTASGLLSIASENAAILYAAIALQR